MKKSYFIISFILHTLVCTAQGFQFNTAGDSYLTTDSPYVATLVNGANQTGGVWFPQQYNLDSAFTIDLILNFGDFNAEGVTFTMQNSAPAPLGTGGSSLGVPSGPSFITEFDLFQNGDQTDAAVPHVSLFQDGSVRHQTGNGLLDATLSPALEQIETLRFEWLPNTTTFNVYRLGCSVQTISYVNDIKSTIFSGNPLIYIGLTASTSLTADSLSFVVEYNSQGLSQNTSICQGESATLHAFSNIIVGWDSSEPFTENAQEDQIVATPSTTAYYFVNQLTACGTIRDSILVTVHDTVDISVNTDLNEEENLADINLILTGGIEPYEITWQLPDLSSSNDQNLSNVPLGTYQVNVVDQNICASQTTFTLELQTTEGQDYFSPNGDGQDERIRITVPGESKVVNSNGKTLRTLQFGDSWDGTDQYGRFLPSGVYLIVGEDQVQTITLLK